ncbi:MAG: (d)CMP kinase [Candidatus Muiribacteriota bacterium]
MSLNIAIDGPAGSGKSTIAKIVSDRLGIYYVDSGAFYRTITWFFIENKIDFMDLNSVQNALSHINLKAEPDGLGFKVFINEIFPGDKIRTREVTRAVSPVSAISCVRDYVNGFFQKIGEKHSIVMEGRDIGTVVLPEAELKIFLVATPEERARRRLKELQQKGENYPFDEILEDIIKRDKYDSTREVAPLKKSSDAVEVDTTVMTIEEVVETILNHAEKKKN